MASVAQDWANPCTIGKLKSVDAQGRTFITVPYMYMYNNVHINKSRTITTLATNGYIGIQVYIMCILVLGAPYQLWKTKKNLRTMVEAAALG